MKTTRNENSVLATLSPEPGLLRLTKTMLDKAIIDANLSIRAFASQFGVDMVKMEAGDREQVEAQYTDGTPCTLSFYRTANRGDKRFSCSGIKTQAGVGDLVALTTESNSEGEMILVVNVSKVSAGVASLTA